MNVTTDNLAPLPSAIAQRRQDGLARRHRIVDHDPDGEALSHFNDLLQQLAFPVAPLDGDQLASAARELVDEAGKGTAPHCIRQRMRRGAAIDMMATDPDWETHGETALRACRTVADYLRGSLAVIPNRVPVVGRLDDAIVVEAAWPAVAREVFQYLMFRHVRNVEAQLRGESRRHFGFTRGLLQAAMDAEAAWAAHCHRVGQSTYLAAGGSEGFRVH